MDSSCKQSQSEAKWNQQGRSAAYAAALLGGKQTVGSPVVSTRKACNSEHELRSPDSTPKTMKNIS